VVGTSATAYAIAIFARVAWPSILIGWVVLVPWLVVLDRTRSMRGALAAGLLMSVAFVTMVFPWLPRMIADYTGEPWPLGVAVSFLLAPVIEPQLVTFALARRLAQGVPGGARWWRTALIGAAAYVGTEWAFPKLLADTLGHGVYASPRLRQAADLIGVHGLMFALIVGNECVLAVLRALLVAGNHAGEGSARPWTTRVAAPASCFVLLVGALAAYGSLRLAQLGRLRSGEQVTVAIVQGNIAHYDRLKDEVGTFEAVRQILDVHFALSAEALQRNRPDLLIWPETVYPTTFGAPKSADGADFDRAIAGFVAQAGVPLVFGAYAAEGTKEFNAAVLLEPTTDGRVVADAYRKGRLFPFTEYLPWPLDSDRVRRWMPWAGAWTPGRGPQVLAADLAGGRRARIAPLICYDALDPDFVVTAVRHGADLLVTLSNDSWFAYPGVQRLIMIVSAFASIETRRPQLRSTPTGVSAVIDETGAVLDLVDVDRRGVLVGMVRPAHGTWTLMLAWGDWLPPTALTGSLVLLLAAYRRRPLRASAV
jgi:apolipoprotein N-acyltransferase